MGDIYKTWVDFGIDGFRIDTVKHVNLEFWQKFVPAILDEAKARKNDDFFAFGEVYDGNPAVMSEYTTARQAAGHPRLRLPAAGRRLRQGQAGIRRWPTSSPRTTGTPTPTATPTSCRRSSGTTTWAGWRCSSRTDGQSEAEHLKRVEFADSLMFTSRGNPVTYYGDEQGFVSTGGDQARPRGHVREQGRPLQHRGRPRRARGLAGPLRHRRTRSTSTSPSCRPCVPSTRPWPMARRSHRYAADGAGIFATSRIGAGTKGGRNVGRSSTSSRRTTTPRRPRRPSRRGPRVRGRVRTDLRHRHGRQAVGRGFGEGHRARRSR